MDKIKLAYLAGIIDGEGSISIAIDTWRQRELNRTPSYQERITIAMCDPEPLYLLQEIFGGNITTQKKRAENRRPSYRWQANNLRAIEVVKAILPYLRVKKRQAEIMLRLRKIKDRGRKANTYNAGPRIRRLKPEVVAEMHELATQIRQFNDTRFPLPLS